MEIVLASTQKHFADVFRIRTNVFIGEQHVPAQEEIDELDQFVPILVAYEGDMALGTARVIETKEGYAKIGRVAVLKEARQKGVGSVNQIKLDAQIGAQKFYESLGFIAHGEVFLDAGIDHISMVRFIKR